MTQDCKLDFLNVRKGDIVFINMGKLHNNPDEWQEPEQFIPDRFNSRSPYFLTPAGKARNTFSFAPFLGGQRICIGKTFIEAVSKLTVPTLISNFEMAFLPDVDPSTFEMPHNHLITTFMLKNNIVITQRK